LEWNTFTQDPSVPSDRNVRKKESYVVRSGFGEKRKTKGLKSAGENHLVPRQSAYQGGIWESSVCRRAEWRRTKKENEISSLLRATRISNSVWLRWRKVSPKRERDTPQTGSKLSTKRAPFEEKERKE